MLSTGFQRPGAAAAKPASDGGKDNKQELDALTAEWSELRDEKIRLQSEQKRLREELEAAEADSAAKFGTADLDELRSRVEAIDAANAQAISEFAESLRKVREKRAQATGA